MWKDTDADNRADERNCVMCHTRNQCVAAIVFVVALGCIVGCQRRTVHFRPSRFDAVAAGQAAVKEYDTDGDGKIAGAELGKCPCVKAAIDQIDPSGKGEVTSERRTARIRAWEQSRLGTMGVRCRVTHNGAPLPDAEVTFVPEKF